MRATLCPALIRLCGPTSRGEAGVNGNVDVNGRTIWTLFLALLPGFFGLTAFVLFLDLLAGRFGDDPAPNVRGCRLLVAYEHSLRRLLPQDSTQQECAESESDETDEDEKHHLVMSFSELLPTSGPNPVRGMGWPSGRPTPRVAAPLLLLSQHLVC